MSSGNASGGASATSSYGGASSSSGASAGTGVNLGDVMTAGTGSGTVDNACAETTQNGQLVPLDIYVMLDISSSMLDQTSAAANAPTKWAAVKQALTTFLGDQASAGIGVGIQYFPLTAAGVPDSCTSDAECGTHGPCFLKFCQTAGPGIFGCGSSSECVTAAGEDVGPCVPLTYCYPPSGKLTLCHNSSECGAGVSCVPFNECSGNTDYSCPVAGTACRSGGMDLGTCRAFNPTSICLHPTSCDVASYAAPAVNIAVLPGSSQGLLASINQQMPFGDTPTEPALQGAIRAASTWASAHPDHKVVALLATDGLPTECVADPNGDPTGINGVRSAAAAGVAATPSIDTYVIGVFGPTDTDARSNLNQIAVAGGTNSAFLVDTAGDVSAQFLAALNAIRSSQLTCEYAVPAAPAGQDLNYSLVNVDFTNGATKERLIGVADASACGASGGWYYDQNPATGGTPTKIEICPSACSRLEAAKQGSIQIALGCQTKIR